MPESRNPRRADRSARPVLRITGLLLLVYGIQHGGDTQKLVLHISRRSIVGGPAIPVAFIWLEVRSDHPVAGHVVVPIRIVLRVADHGVP